MGLNSARASHTVSVMIRRVATRSSSSSPLFTTVSDKMGRENASLNDIHRLFIQAIISRRTVSDKLARILWRKCIQAVKSKYKHF